MIKLLKSQRGAVDIILIIVVLVLAGALGGYVYYQQQQNKKAIDSANSQVSVAKHAKKPAPKPADPYAGWKTYASANEPVSFKYPTSWTFTEKTNDHGLNGDDKQVVLSSPNGVTLNYLDSVGGLGGSCVDEPNVKLTDVAKLSIPKSKMDVYLVESGKELALDSAVISGKAPAVGDTGSCIFVGLLPGKDSDHHPAFTTTIMFPSGSPKPVPANQASDFDTAKLILKSFSYN